MLYEWVLANKAAYVGARVAVVSDPVAAGITDPTWDPNVQLGTSCIKNDGTANADAKCPSVTTVCTASSTSAGTCSGSPGSATFNSTAFDAIFNPMQQMFSRLQPQNVQISYQTTGLGFVGRPGGLPMTVTVSIRCMTHQFYFIGALMDWVFTPPAGCDPAPAAGPSIPAFATTLTSEDMETN
jgi:hypothetical protein